MIQERHFDHGYQFYDIINIIVVSLFDGAECNEGKSQGLLTMIHTQLYISHSSAVNSFIIKLGSVQGMGQSHSKNPYVLRESDPESSLHDSEVSL